MSFRYTKRIAAAKKKIRTGFKCGCGLSFFRRRTLQTHKGLYWPGCPITFVQDQALLSTVGVFIDRPEI